MTTLNLSQVSKEFKVSRSTIYRAISSGKLSRLHDGEFDLAEVIRCFGEPVATPVIDIKSNEASLIQAEFNEYKKKVEDEINALKADKEFLQTHLKQITLLLELKNPVPEVVPMKQPNETHCDKNNNYKNNDLFNFDTQVRQSETLNKEHSVSLKPKRFFNRLIQAILNE
jgi:hypothetical protein